MAFRDDNEAQRARAHQLEAELEEARERIRALEGAEEARARAEARIAELERAPKKETPRQRARREKEERKAQQRKERQETRKAAPPRAEKRFVVFGIVAIIVAVTGAVLSHREREPSLTTPDLTAQLDPHAQPSEGTVMLMQGAHRYEGTSTPRFSAQALAANCAGFVSQVPTLGLTVGQPEFVAMEVAEDDALVVLQGPSGVLCDVAEGPQRARVGAMLSTGAYRIWVGRRHASTSSLTHVLAVTQGSDALPDLTHGTVVIPMLPSE